MLFLVQQWFFWYSFIQNKAAGFQDKLRGHIFYRKLLLPLIKPAESLPHQNHSVARIASLASGIEIIPLFDRNADVSGSRWPLPNAVSLLQMLQERPDLVPIQRLGAAAAGARSGSAKTGTLKSYANVLFLFLTLLSFPFLKLYAISQAHPHGFGFHQCTHNVEAIQKYLGGSQPVLLL